MLSHGLSLTFTLYRSTSFKTTLLSLNVMGSGTNVCLRIQETMFENKEVFSLYNFASAFFDLYIIFPHTYFNFVHQKD